MDLVFRNARVVDGTGGPERTVDVAVDGDRIAVVGEVTARGGVEVDAAGLVLAPGFIDVHSHDDFAVFLTPGMDFKTGQGVTTTIVGNCGLGAAPHRSALSYLSFFGAEGRRSDVPEWDGYGGYLDAVDADPPACNVAALVGHGTARLSVMRGSDAAPLAREALHLADVVEEGLSGGAVGMSTGLVYEPGKHADTDEIVTLARIMAVTGGRYTSHIRNEGVGLLAAVSEAIEIGRRAGVGVQISHHKAAGEAAWGLVAESLALIEAARDDGLDVLADQYPYTAGSTSLGAVVHSGGFAGHVATGLGVVPPESVVLASCPETPAWEGRSIAALATEFGIDAAAAADRVLDIEGAGAVVVIHSMCEDDVRTVMAHPTTMIGSDGVPTLGGRPHPRLYGTCARVLGTYVRDEPLLGLTEAVHRMTGLPARAFGLVDRGVIHEGAFADLVLFDSETVDDVATYEDPRRHPVGIEAVWVNGRRVVTPDGVTEARPGRALRRT